MPKPQIYCVRDGKTYRKINDDEIYVLDGVASNVQKTALTNWLKSGMREKTIIPPYPWRLEEAGDDMIDEEDSSIENELSLRSEQRFDEIMDTVQNPGVIEKAEAEKVIIKPILYNIKQVPDDRRRTGYAVYRRM
jgi:hypothetical protein